MKLEVRKGDITRISSHAIVNAANRYLEHGGGVAYAIAKAAAGDAGEYIRVSREAMREQIGRDFIDPGEVVVTPALNLGGHGIRYVIHTVGPRCGGRWNEDLEEKLRRAILGPLKKAEEMGLESVAFPAISTGIYGCPFEEFVKVFKGVVEEFGKEGKRLKRVYLVLYTEKEYEKARELIGEITL